MDVIFTHCAGLDVHKKSVMACRLIPDPTGRQADGLIEVWEFGTLTIDLLAFSDWLAEAGITHVAMKSTAEYWKPVFNLLEGNFQLFLGHAAYVTRAPGWWRRKITLLEQALTELVCDHRWRRLVMPLAPIDFLDEQIYYSGTSV
jgi:hypothetical protein